MIRTLVVGFGLATAVGTLMFACGGDDTSGGGGAGTTSGTAGSGSGTAGSTGTSTGGSAGSVSGTGGAITLDGSFDLDALGALVGNYTCADLMACCATLTAQYQSACNTIVSQKVDTNCSLALTGFKSQALCK